MLLEIGWYKSEMQVPIDELACFLMESALYAVEIKRHMSELQPRSAEMV